MKAYKWFFLIFVSGILMSCTPTSQEEWIGDWKRCQPPPGGGRCHAATFVIGDKGYVVGGYNGTNKLRTEVFEFDHTAGKKGGWSEMDPLPNHIPPRYQAVGFSLNGKGYMGTGWAYLATDNETSLKDFWRYDPANDSWEEVAPLPERAKVRRGAIAFSLEIPKGGKSYGFVGCGYTGEPDKEYLLDFWKFDPDGTTDELPGKWTRLEEEHDLYLGYKRYGGLVFVIDNKAYICVGEDSQNITEFWVFDPNAPKNEQWNELRKMADANKDEDYDDDYGPLARVFGVAYVADINQWIGGVMDLRGHVTGGRGSTNWEYDHHADLWTQRTHFYNNSAMSSREGMISFSFPSSGRAFVGMGKAGTAYIDDLWEFIPLKEDNTFEDHK